MYSINCITTWSKAWRKNGWLTSGKKEPVKNRDLIEPCVALYEALEGRVRLAWVRGHGDCEGNIEADLLATAAAKLVVATREAQRS